MKSWSSLEQTWNRPDFAWKQRFQRCGTRHLRCLAQAWKACSIQQLIARLHPDTLCLSPHVLPAEFASKSLIINNMHSGREIAAVSAVPRENLYATRNHIHGSSRRIGLFGGSRASGGGVDFRPGLSVVLYPSGGEGQARTATIVASQCHLLVEWQSNAVRPEASMAELWVYNAPNPEMLAPSSRVYWAWCVLLLFSQIGHASDWRKTEAQLAEKIAAITGPGVVALEVTNRSSISPSEADEIRRGLIGSLANSGVRVFEPDQAAATAQVTLSESLQNYVWVAEIRQGTNDAIVAIVSTPRPDSAVNPQSAPPLTIRGTQLISQLKPILDVAILEGSPRRMLVLGEGAVTVYEFKDGHWVPGQFLAINHDRPLPRDVRGRIMLRKDHLFDAYLPGLICSSTNASPLALNCSRSDDPWPLQTEDFGVSAFFAPARNFFTGALVPGIGQQKLGPAFYSAAAVPRGKYALWIFAGVDGQLRLLDSMNQQTEAKIHWGSDLAGIHAACRQEWQIMATSAASGTGDSIQAFEFPDREPVAVSQTLPLSGNITTLWTAGNGDSAIAVFRDSETGSYEAVQLTLTCGQ